MLAELGDYENCREEWRRVTYLLARQHLEKEEWQEAQALLEDIPDEPDAAELLKDVRYQRAGVARPAGELQTAFDLYGQLRDYRDAADLYRETGYELAAQLDAAGEPNQAAAIYSSLGQYKDAETLARESYDSYYKEAYEAARIAYQAKNWEGVMLAAEGLDLESAGGEYSDFVAMWREAAYAIAESLYAQNRDIEAYAYYKRLEGYRDVSTKKLTRQVYLLFGTWKSSSGDIFEFREDGTCLINGQRLFYQAHRYQLRCGNAVEDLSITYQIVNLREKTLTLKGTSKGNSKTYRMTRVEEPAAEGSRE